MPLQSTVKHYVLKEAVLENGPGSLFIFSYIACICVHLTSSERPRFCSSTEVSPVLAGILHFASVTALMHITKYKCEFFVDEKRISVHSAHFGGCSNKAQ